MSKSFVSKVVTAFAILMLSGAASGSILAPVVCNPGFEEGANGWGWTAHNGARATFRTETSNCHSGRRCMAFSNESGQAPHVYGRFTSTVEVLPDTQYELSVWVRGTDVAGNEGANHFTDWSTYTLNLPTGTFGWEKRSVVFRTKPGQYYLTLGLNVADRAKELVIDDVSLTPIGEPITGAGVSGFYLVPNRLIGHNAAGYLGILINAQGGAVEASISSGERRVFSRRANLRPGTNRLEWDWSTGNVPFGTLDLRINVLNRDGRVAASVTDTIEKVESPISAEIDKAEARFKEFEAIYAKCKAKKIPLDYVTAARTTIQQFIPLAREDIQKGHDWRASFAAQDFMRMLDEGIAQMQAYLKDPSLAPIARRFKTGKVKVEGVSLIGDTVDAKGKKDTGPVFFCGYGHFGQVRTDMPRWPGYGVNIIQIEVGPSVTFPREDEADLKAAKAICDVLDDAARHNVRVDVLLSPHYFPQWALNKWPHLAKGGGHFINYCIDAPEAKQVIEKFLRTVVPMMKDKPALNSFCLSNEPVLNNTSGMDNTKTMWASYLKRIHGDVTTLSERYGKKYDSFADVPIPGNEAYSDPQFYDYVVFNNERFAAWHEWMATVIKSMAPNVPVHAKMMSMAIPYRFTVAWGCDPELFGKLSDLNGNDCLIRGRPGAGGWGIPWHSQNMSYDLQRSLARKPIFNSENHPTEDRSTYYVPPEYMRTALWQGAVHGQGATTIWAWERCFIQDHDFYGNVMDRPGCAQAVGVTCLDLNRFAQEMTALQNAKAPVAIVYSIASTARSATYLPTLHKAYEALNFCGVKIDFISERQLAEGKGREYRLIVLPEATHLPFTAFEALVNMPRSTQLIIVGKSPEHDPYGKAFAESEFDLLESRAILTEGDVTPKSLFPLFRARLKALGALPMVSVVDATTGEPPWGVEWLPVTVGGRTVINMVNLTDKPVDVKIIRGEHVIYERMNAPTDIRDVEPALNAVDLLSLGAREKVKTLKPITPVLAEVAK